MNEQESLPLSCISEYGNTSIIQVVGLSNINESLSVHYLIYKIENIYNHKHYIGQHYTDNPYDTYMGSGQYLKAAIKKYGTSSFIKEILFDFNNFDDMNNIEIELVQLSNCFPYDQLSYNLIPGGCGTRTFSETTRQRMAKAKIGKKPGNTGKHMSDECRQRISKIRLKQNAERRSRGEQLPGNYNKHSEEQNKRHSLMMKGRMAGEKHPLYGTHRSDETKQKLSQTLKARGCSKKDKNSNYKKSPKDWMSPEQYAKWRQDKCGRKCLIKGNIKIMVKPSEFRKYLENGFKFKDKKFKYD